MDKKACFTSNSDEWYTPDSLYDELYRRYGFTLDPCGCEESHKCEKYYNINDDGLSKSWSYERVFCNTPYSDIKSWVKKAHDEILYNNCKIVVLLLPARTDTRWFHDYIYNKFDIIFLKGRIKFSGSKNSAPFPSMLVIMR